MRELHTAEESDRFHEACAALGVWGLPDAAQYSLDEIRHKLHVDSIGYLSLEAMVGATGHPASRFDLSPFNGEYSTLSHFRPL